jgi:hypothetical protein
VCELKKIHLLWLLLIFQRFWQLASWLISYSVLVYVESLEWWGSLNWGLPFSEFISIIHLYMCLYSSSCQKMRYIYIYKSYFYFTFILFCSCNTVCWQVFIKNKIKLMTDSLCNITKVKWNGNTFSLFQVK